MKNIVWKVILILAVIALCLWAVYPPDQKIRLGKDLQGGTSLIYLVSIPDEAGEKQEILAQTIEVLKERVNPQGVLDISMQPLGADRIEIVMPLPSDKVKDLRRQYDVALTDLLRQSHIKPTELDEALRFNTAMQRFGGDGTSERSKTIAKLQEAYNKYQEARTSLDEAKSSGAAADQIARFEHVLANAQFDYEQLRDSVRQSNLDQARVIRTLNLPTAPDAKTAQADPAALSPREIALNDLKAEFPHLAEPLSRTVATFDTYQTQRTTLDDPEDLMRLLRGAGVLEFHIAVRPNDAQGVNVANMREQLKEVGPNKTDSAVARWYPINELKQWYSTPEQLAALEADPEGFFSNFRGLVGAEQNGRYYLLLYTTRAKSMTHSVDTPWTVESTGITVDQRLGRPAVSFRLDPSGGNMMSRLTGPHVGEPMAIVLDDQVYSAPTLENSISNSGIVTGDFSKTELDYLTRVLAAGALGARLSDQPIAINTLGPSIGADNLRAGMQACFLSILAVGAFMLVYYFGAGFIAIIALAVNGIFIFGIMSLIEGTFTLPGLAGIALTIGTAVDANILIYERIREELERGADLRTAVRLGYDKALSAILDSNLTNLWVCIALILTATTEVKGFAYTMTIGIVGTLFTALFMTKVIYAILLEWIGIRRLPMLATTFPAVRRALEPHVDWISLRRIMVPGSAILVLISWVLVFSRGAALFDTEFRGGLAATMRTAVDPATGERLKIKQTEFERQIRDIGRTAESMPPSDARDVLNELKQAEVLTVGDTELQDGKLAASGFQVKLALPPDIKETASFKDTVVNAIVEKIGSQLDVAQPLSFVGVDSARHESFTSPVNADQLGQVIARPQYTQDISAYRGGVAVVLDDITPPATTAEIASRINRLREQPDFSDTNGREMEVIGLEPADPSNLSKGYTSAAVVVSDPQIDYTRVEFESWDSRLAAREWKLISEALARPATFEQVAEFSSAVASTLRASAVVAVALSLLGILVYIWIRFGSLRYSAGAVLSLVHDVSLGLGALALTQIIGETAFAKALLIEPFHIDLEVVAAILTLIGYSLNDTIVVLDRIRENRGKLQFPTAETVNKSINQTFSRTILTNLTMLISLLVMYIEGGTGIRAFSFVMLIGMFVGTYSSIAIAAPLVYKGHDVSPPKGGTKVEPKSREALPATV